MRCKNLIPCLSLSIAFLINNPVFSQQLEKQVIAAAGIAAGSSYTVGEAVILEGGIRLIAGFQQPSEVEEVVELGFRDISHQLAAYPNPAQQHVTISGESFDAAKTEVALFDLAGNELQVRTETTITGLRINFPAIVRGQYLLLLRDTDAKTTAHFKLIKN